MYSDYNQCYNAKYVNIVYKKSIDEILKDKNFYIEYTYIYCTVKYELFCNLVAGKY